MGTRTKVLLTAASLGVIGIIIAVATSALFSASVTTGPNIAASGSLDISVNKTVIFDSTSVGSTDGWLKPFVVTGVPIVDARAANAVVAGDVTVSNSNAAADAQSISVNLVQSQVGGTLYGGGSGTVGGKPAIFKKAQLCISSLPLVGSGCDVYSSNFDLAPASPDGTGDSIASTGISLGNIAVGASKALRFEIYLPNDADTDNAYQSQKATAEFKFDAS